LKSFSANTGNDDWTAAITRNQLGQEVTRFASGNVHVKTKRDSYGRVVNQQIVGNNVEGRNVKYQWGEGDRLLKMVNNITGATTNFGYTEDGSLAWGEYGNSAERIYKMPDAKR